MYEEILKEIEEECIVRNISPGTKKLYVYNTRKFLEWLGDKPREEICLQDARNYLLDRRKQGAEPSYCNSMCSALSFLYRRILHTNWDLDVVPRMKINWRLPQVLSREEIDKLIETATEIRNKAIIALIYSSGLRVGEVCKLAPEDIYMSTMQVHVRNSKNRGDHWTVLSEQALELLKEYWRSYPVKRDHLFVTLRKPHTPINAGGIEAMLKRVGKDAGIHVYPHMLRHSFATHLIENDTNREFIRTMLGHRSPASIDAYIHVSNKVLMGVKSPLDLPRKEPEHE